jgi:hypothetical protein
MTQTLARVLETNTQDNEKFSIPLVEVADRWYVEGNEVMWLIEDVVVGITPVDDLTAYERRVVLQKRNCEGH